MHCSILNNFHSLINNMENVKDFVSMTIDLIAEIDIDEEYYLDLIDSITLDPPRRTGKLIRKFVNRHNETFFIQAMKTVIMLNLFPQMEPSDREELMRGYTGIKHIILEDALTSRSFELYDTAEPIWERTHNEVSKIKCANFIDRMLLPKATLWKDPRMETDEYGDECIIITPDIEKTINSRRGRNPRK